MPVPNYYRPTLPFRALRRRGIAQQPAQLAPGGAQAGTNSKRVRAARALLSGPRLLWTGAASGPRLLLRAPGAIVRAPGSVRARTQRLFSTSRLRRQQPLEGQPAAPEAGPSTEKPNESFTSRLRKRIKDTPTTWYPIPLGLGAAVLGVVSFYKSKSWEEITDSDDPKGKKPVRDDEIKVKGPWQVHVIGALPLRSLSRLYGTVNNYTLPVWFRVPGYKLYAYVFGVNLEECEPGDLKEYRSMSEFFMRKLKPGVRPIADVQLVSPADGKVVNFGVVEGGRVEQVKGSTYSLEALLSGTGQDKTPETFPGHAPHPQQTEGSKVDEREFANINDIQYSLDELIGPDGQAKQTDQSLTSKEQAEQPDGPKRTLSGDANVAMEVAPASAPWSSGHVPKPGNKLFFTVIYLAPGDYHRFHSPTSWVVEKRRHFAGELFSVSPWMANKLQDLFVLNERVALLGRWRHGFFSMVPVGATNVGSIRVNFDRSLRTNSPLRPITPGTFSEATYAKASALLRGQPLQSGDEIGGFWLGSTIVLVFEAPEAFKFNLSMNQRVKVGEALGDVVR
ncbi:phosphatidylserine decarboxylase [Pseudohyphozyma bogoriensis]|nr:phosphatidylserine decarboxylase [Pseudohyphozyma bogoriensis]